MFTNGLGKMLIIGSVFMYKTYNKLTNVTKNIQIFIDFYVKKVYYVYCIGISNRCFRQIYINLSLKRRVLLWQTDYFKQ